MWVKENLSYVQKHLTFNVNRVKETRSQDIIQFFWLNWIVLSLTKKLYWFLHFRYLLPCFLRLKGQCHEIFCFCLFLESVSPKPLIITLGLFRIFSKFRGDIRSLRFATSVNDTCGKWQKLSSRKILIILFGHLWVVELTYI